ncbi:hypothetical protein [Clostridium sp. UBA5988]|uniref:hypothetical protein n=1 Tax=Clostridium sp. UBA5988 TaxID=1946369 RepID=UPI0032166AEA
MNNDIVLKIDLKNRISTNSIIINTNDISGINKDIIIDLNFNLKVFEEYIIRREYEKAYDYLKNSYRKFLCIDYEFLDYNARNLNGFIYLFHKFQEFGNISNTGTNIAIYKSLKNCMSYINKIKMYSDSSLFENLYNDVIIYVEHELSKFDIFKILKECKKRIEKLNYTTEDFELIDELYILGSKSELEKEILVELSSKIYNIRKYYIENYNKKIDLEKSIEILIGNKYKEILSDCFKDKYLEKLSVYYNTYEKFLSDVEQLYKLYCLNNSLNFQEYYNNLLSLPVDKLINLTSYLREYVSRKLYNENREYYDVNDLNLGIENIVRNLDIKNNSKTIPLV